MSITKEAITAVNCLGSGTVDDVQLLLPGYTRAQLFRALKHAVESGRLATDGWRPAPRGSSPRQGATPATYRAIKKTSAKPAASVWQFADQCQASA